MINYLEDKEIIDLYWMRSESAISETDIKYGSYCRSISYNIVNNNEDAEECVNDTYLQVWNAIPPTRPNRFMAFVGKITRNISLNLLKKKNASKRGGREFTSVVDELEECIPDKFSIDKNIEQEIIVNCINEFLRDQSDLNADIFVRRYWYMDNISGISERYGIKQNTIVSTLYRMRQELKTRLEKEGVLV